ncbi:hypothetical protein [Flavonifractor sp. An52]|uniref:hypothetical protein n=1 Tax=Flavonifractor sp. An52 TaxID=1965642 RepID=UPI00117B57FA|nr:hypothetical protein [Flavonifractor sp. An52]
MEVSFFFTTVVIICVIAGIIVWNYEADKENEGIRKRNAERLEKLRQTFSQQSVGTPLSSVIVRFKSCEAISDAILESEVVLPDGKNRKVYIWYLDWYHTISQFNGRGYSPNYSSTTTLNGGNMAVSHNSGYSMNIVSGATTQKAYIRMIFENDMLVAKEQQGLFS